jgi:DNA-binding protein HU-beta
MAKDAVEISTAESAVQGCPSARLINRKRLAPARKIAVTPTRNRDFIGEMHGKPTKNQEKRAFFAFYGWRKRENHLFDGSFRGLLTANGGRSMVKAAQPTVTLKHLAHLIATQHELAKKQSEAILNDMVGLVVKHLKKGDRIRIGGLGILQVRKRAARMGRNPATGEPIKIKASKKVAFRAAKELKESI